MKAPELTPSLAHQMLACSADGIFVYDRSGGCLFWNAAMERISGMKAVDVVGQPLFDLFPFLLEIGEEVYMRLAMSGQEAHSRGRPFRVAATGRQGFFDGLYRPLLDETGAVVGGIAVIRDVTERTRTEEQLRETETRFRNMADVSPVLLWMAETNGLCTFFNQTWLSFTGRTFEEEWGVGWAEGVHFEDFQRCMDTYNEAFGERRIFEMEYRLRRADGEFRWVLDRGAPRYRPDGAFAGFIGSCVDITERRAAEAELRHAVRVRDEFLSVASHELRTPLTPLQLQVDRLDRLLRGGVEKALRSGALTEMAAALKGQVGRITDLVNVLLDLSQVASGRLKLETAPLDLADVAHQVVDRWRPSAAAMGCQLVFQASGPVTRMGDRLRLEQVLNNLISNAIKYGQGRPIAVRLQDDVDRVRLSVTDQGIGISQDDQTRIFERFQRAVPVENYGGLGLGLWIVRQIVETMGGTVGVKSALGKGAHFQVDLPRSPEDAVVPPGKHPEPIRSGPATAGT